MCSNGSSSSISLLTVTPSLVTNGLPKLLSMMTFRPVGPIVTATASASVLTPRCNLIRARSSNNSCFATSKSSLVRLESRLDPERCGLLHDLGQDVAFPEDLQILSLDLDVGAAVFAEQDFVADLDGNFG